MPVNTIAMPCSSAARDDLGVAHRAAGLNHRLDAELGERVQPVAEREERIGGHATPIAAAGPFVLAFMRRDLAARPRGSSGPRRCRGSPGPSRRRCAFDLTYLATRHANMQIVELLDGRRRAAGDHAQVLRPRRAIVARLHQQAAGDAAVFEQLRSRGLPRSADLEHAHVVLGREQPPALRRATRGARITSTNCRVDESRAPWRRPGRG